LATDNNLRFKLNPEVIVFKKYNFAILAFSVLSGISFAAQAQYGSSNQTAIFGDGTPRSPDRFVRRLIVEGSFANAGYQGGDSPRYSSPNGYAAGGVADLLGSNELVLETGVLYRQFGTNYSNGLGNNSFTANYISVPVDAKYYFSGQEATSLYLKLGVLGSTLISNNNYYPTPTTQIGAKAWETAALGGIGAKFAMTSATDVIVEADYARALDSVFDGYNVYRSDFIGSVGVALNL
jgi:hypothetical protein